jgi:hypothetical protein
MEFIEPELILNVHTHDTEFMKEEDKFDVILYNPEKNSYTLKELEKSLKDQRFKVSVREKIKFNEKDSCSPMLFENMIYFYEGKSLDGCYISVDQNQYIFEKEWRKLLTSTLTKTLK